MKKWKNYEHLAQAILAVAALFLLVGAVQELVIHAPLAHSIVVHP